MSRHRQQHNPINAAALAWWIVITLFVGGSGLIYVWQSVQLHSLGDQKRKLEVELVEVRAENEVASVQIAALTSREAIERRHKEGYLKMHPIGEQHIVRLNFPTRALGADAIQPVSNPRVGR
jgi:cell division protein FtsB